VKKKKRRKGKKKNEREGRMKSHGVFIYFSYSRHKSEKQG
jgi:hypothetical protein